MSAGPPAGVRSVTDPVPGSTRVVLVRHGEAACNVNGLVGGTTGCTGLTDQGMAQVGALAERLAATGELAGVGALYTSVLPRAQETARLLAPALDRWRDGPPLEMVADCGLCELHPGSADGLAWEEATVRYGEPDWATDPDRPLAPGGESWSTFVPRASSAVAAVATSHPGELVVIACHAGVVVSTLEAFLPITGGSSRARFQVDHASMTEWEWSERGWVLRRFNDLAR